MDLETRESISVHILPTLLKQEITLLLYTRSFTKTSTSLSIYSQAPVGLGERHSSV